MPSPDRGAEFRFDPPTASWAEGPGEGHRARKTLLFLGMAVLCAVLGLNLVFFPPTFLFGALFGLAAMVAILYHPFWGLILYAALFLVRPAELYPAIGALHVERIVGAVTLVAIAASMIRREGKLLVDGSRQTLLLGLFLVALVLSVPGSYWPTRSAERVVDFLKIVAFYLMIVHLVDTRKRLWIFSGAYMVLILVVAGTSLRAYFGGYLMFAQGIERAVGVTSAGGDPNSLGATLGSAIPFFLLGLGVARRWWQRGLLLGGAGVLIWTVALTGSRSSMLGLAAAVVTVWLFTRRKVLLGVLGLLAVLIGFSVLPDSYRERYATITSQELDESSRLRVDTWRAGGKMVLDRPLFGVGVGTFGAAHATGYSGARENWLEAHSLYVQVPAEVGLIGAVIYAGFLIVAFRLNRRAARRLGDGRAGWARERILLDAVFAGFVFLAVYSIFGHTMLRFTWFVYAAIGLAAYRLHVDRDRGPAPDPAPDSR